MADQDKTTFPPGASEGTSGAIKTRFVDLAGDSSVYAPAVGAYIYSGTIWVPWKTRSGLGVGAISSANSNYPVVLLRATVGNGDSDELFSASADGLNGVRALLVNAAGFNEATVDRWRSNTQGTLLASAARTATTTSADQTLYNARGVRVRINVSALAAAPSITVAIQEKDSISGNYRDLLVSAAIVATGQKATLILYPGVTVAANVAVSEPLPRTWRVNVTHGNADSITYSVDYAAIL